MNARPQTSPPSSDDDLPPAPAVVGRKRKKAAEPEKKPRPVWFRYATWLVLALLAVGLAIEARAQAYFRHNLHIAQEAIERTEGNAEVRRTTVTYDDIKDRMWGTPQTSTGTSDFVPRVVYTWSWHGLRTYVLRIYVDPKGGQLRDVKSEP